MLGRTDSRRRLLVLLTIFAIGSLALFARTAYWQVLNGDFLMARAAAQTTVRIEVAGRRGDIYDRTGTVLLATTIDRDRLVAAADQLARDREARTKTGNELVRILKLDEAEAKTIREKLASERPYVIIARGIEPSVAERLRQAMRDERVEYLALEAEPERVYPQTGGGPESTLAAHLLGFVNRENVGQYGVEQAYQETLAGSPRVMVAQRDVGGRPVPETSVVEQPGSIGEDVRLTIDASLQLALEQELLAAWIADEAKSVSAVVLDPYTGEVYAEATYPSYDANDYRTIARRPRNGSWTRSSRTSTSRVPCSR
jgi:cell division protein FtsI/penicillin-binding protein 2